jgi:hypothetical protein
MRKLLELGCGDCPIADGAGVAEDLLMPASASFEIAELSSYPGHAVAGDERVVVVAELAESASSVAAEASKNTE